MSLYGTADAVYGDSGTGRSVALFSYGTEEKLYTHLSVSSLVLPVVDGDVVKLYGRMGSEPLAVTK